MKTKLILCFALFVAIFIGVSCGEASAQSKKDGHNKLADKGHHHDKDHDPKKEYDSLEKEIWAAVKEGELSKREAMEKLGDLKEEMFGGHDKDFEGVSGVSEAIQQCFFFISFATPL